MAAAAMVFVAVSCQQKEETFTPGDPDISGCYGVFFPAQEAAGSHVYDPDMATEVEFTVNRTNSSGSITVPLVLTSETAEVFQVGDLTFNDGQTESTVVVKFPGINQGTTYSFSLSVEDPQYASNYADGPISIDFSVLQVKWEYYLNPKTGEPAYIHWTQGWWGEEAWGYLKYYEVDGVRHCFTYSTNKHFYKTEYDGYGFWGVGENENDWELSFNWYTKDQNSLGYDLIELDWESGYVNSNYDAMVWMVDYFSYANRFGGKNYTPWISYALKYGDPDGDYPCSYYDGNGGFFLNAYRAYMGGIGGWAPDPYDTFGIAEGFDRPVYTLKVQQAGVAAEGEVPVAFSVGADVAKVAYNFLEGSLTATQIANAIEALDENSPAITEGSGTYSFNLGATGEYTLVAAGFDAEGEKQSSASCSIVYLAAEDAEEYAVVINGGVGSAAKYAPEGINTDSAIEFYVYGEDIVEAKVAAFSYLDLMSGVSACRAALMKTKSLDADAIAAINDKGYVGVFKNLLPGTEYYMMVYASNGYSETTKIFGSEYTTGDPLPIYQNFNIGSYLEEAELENAAAWCGTWNYYAVDYYGSTGLREYLGKVKISASETPTEGPDDKGNYDEYVLVDGLFPNAIVDGPAYGYEVGSCVVEMDVYAGAMYSFAGTTYDGVSTIHTFAKSLDKFYNGVTYYAAFIPVADGYYAMVDTAGSDYDFTGLRVVQSYVWDAFYDMLLVDPAKDDNGLASAPVNAAVQRAKQLVKESAAETGFVLNEKARVREVIKKYMEKQNSVTANDNYVTVKGGECPLRVVKPVSVKYVGPSTATVSARERNEAIIK